MPVKIKPINEIKIRLGIDANGRVQKYFTEQCYKHMDKYVPYDEGNLSTIVDIQPTWITYESEYARYQYLGMRNDGSKPINEANRNRVYHPLASSYWDKKMISAEKEDLEKEMQDYIGGK